MVRAVRRATFAGAICVMACAAQVSGQQGQKSSQEPPAKSMTDGVVAGQLAASVSGSGGSFWGGFAGGLFLGLIGTGIAYVAQGPADIPVVHMAESQKQGSEYTLGFQQGWNEKSKQKKRKSALVGGLLGTAVTVTLLLSASGN